MNDLGQSGTCKAAAWHQDSYSKVQWYLFQSYFLVHRCFSLMNIKKKVVYIYLVNVIKMKKQNILDLPLD